MLMIAIDNPTEAAARQTNVKRKLKRSDLCKVIGCGIGLAEIPLHYQPQIYNKFGAFQGFLKTSRLC